MAPSRDKVTTGGGAYWAGRAAARPLFAPNGQAMMFALPLFALLKFLKRAFLLSTVNLLILSYFVGQMSIKHDCVNYIIAADCHLEFFYGAAWNADAV